MELLGICIWGGFILGAADIVVGALPEKYARYPGAIITVAKKLLNYSKTNHPK